MINDEEWILNACVLGIRKQSVRKTWPVTGNDNY